MDRRADVRYSCDSTLGVCPIFALEARPRVGYSDRFIAHVAQREHRRPTGDGCSCLVRETARRAPCHGPFQLLDDDLFLGIEDLPSAVVPADLLLYPTVDHLHL